MSNYNIRDLLDEVAKKHEDRGYIFEKCDGEYVQHSYKEFSNDVKAFARLLQESGLAGKKVALYGANSYNYMVADIAIMGYVGTSVTLSKEWGIRDVENSINLLDIKAIVYDSSKEEIISRLKNNHSDLLFFALENLPREQEFSGLQTDLINLEDCSKIIFSSGTTGIPKAVMLSQKNMFANWGNLYNRAPFDSNDIDYLFLPLSHTYGGICNFLYSLISGMQIYICSGAQNIFSELQEVKPTMFCAVPLIYERLYSICIEKHLNPKDVLGGNVKYLFCGGAYFNPEIRKFLKSHGLNLLEAYGLSETSSLLSLEYSNGDDFESVGTVLENIDLKIANPDENGIGEIIAKGDNVSRGYYGNKELTEKVFDADGYFHTGDLGYLKNGKLFIKGRKKRMILLSNGENVSPEDVESKFAGCKNINKVKVFEKNKEIFASIYVVQSDGIEDIIEKVNEALPKYSRIQNYEIIADGIDARLK